MKFPRFYDRISFKQARMAVLVALILGLIMAAAQILVDWRKEREVLDQSVNQLLKSLYASAAQAAYGLDRELADRVTKGLFEYKPVFQAVIVDDIGEVLSERRRPHQSGRGMWLAEMAFGDLTHFDLPLQVTYLDQPVGRLTLEVDAYLVARGFSKRILFLVLSGLTRNFLLAFILLLLFHRMLTKPLLAVNEAVMNTEPGSGKPIEIPIPARHETDELGLLSATMNAQLNRFEAVLAQQRKTEKHLRESEEKFRGLFENINEAVALHEIVLDENNVPVDFVFLEVNPAYEEITRLKAEDIIGKRGLEVIPVVEKKWIDAFGKVALTGESIAIIDHSEYLDKYWEVKAYSPKKNQFAVAMTDITDRKLAEDALRKSRERFELAMKFANDGLFDWNLVANEIYYSPGWKRMLGYDDHEIENEFSEWERLTRPEDVEASWAMLNEVLDGKRNRFELEFQMRHKSGRWVDILSRANTVCDESGKAVRLVGTHVDITERKRAEREIIQQKQKAERYLNLAGVMFIGLDIDGNVTVANYLACKILGCDESDILGLNWFDNFVPPSVRNEVRSVFNQLISGQIELAEYYENPIVSKSGEEKIVAWRNACLRDDDGAITGILCSGEDITEKRQLEARLRQAQKMESIGNLAGGIAHDFNNILFPIVGMSELLLEDLPPGSLEHQNAQEILKAGIRGGDLVKQILAFSRRTGHKMMPVRVQQILKEALRLVRSTIPSDIEIAEEIQNDCGLVEANPTQLHQISMNLLTNAYHAVEKTGGKITIQLMERATATGDLPGSPIEPGRYAVLSVSDTGIGIDPTVMDKIFEPYFTTKERGKGTGLGLAVVYGIVKEHKGDIKVYSEPGNGTIFHVYLPLIENGADVASSEKIENLPSGTERILLVDDEEPIASLEKQMLERLGYRVTACLSSVDALDVFSATPDAFDLVITDMNMPIMTGDHLSRKLLAVRPNMPIVICTGFSERMNEEKANAAGIKGFLMKPVVKSEMAAMIRKVLGDAKSSALDG